MGSRGILGRSEFVNRAPDLSFIGPFDGIRGIGVIAVVVAHATEEHLAGLAAIVDLFFVVSGFLITTLLLQEHRSSGRVNLRSFFERRALRLLPVLYLVLAVTLVVGLIVGSAEFRSQVISDVGAAGLYVYHVVHPVNEVVVGGGVPEARPLIQLWSLSVEEHFYLFGALLTVLALKFRLVKQLLVAFVAFVVFVAIARWTGHVGFRMMWYQRPDALAMGVVLALVNCMIPPELPQRSTRMLRVGGSVAMFVFLFVIFIGTTLSKPTGLYFQMWPDEGDSLADGLYWGEFGYTISALAAGVIILALLRGGSTRMSRLLSGRGVRSVGRRSYVIYIIHFPLAMLLFEAVSARSPKVQAAALLLYLPLLVLTSELTHRYVEKPAMRYRARPASVARSEAATPEPVSSALEPSEPRAGTPGQER